MPKSIRKPAEVTGKLTVDTRYLIRGPLGSEKTREAYEAMVNAARQVGAETISVDKLMDKIGWRDPNQVVRFGRDSNAEQYKPRLPDGGIPQIARQRFRNLPQAVPGQPQR